MTPPTYELLKRCFILKDDENAKWFRFAEKTRVKCPRLLQLPLKCDKI